VGGKMRPDAGAVQCLFYPGSNPGRASQAFTRHSPPSARQVRLVSPGSLKWRKARALGTVTPMTKGPGMALAIALKERRREKSRLDGGLFLGGFRGLRKTGLKTQPAAAKGFPHGKGGMIRLKV